MAAFPPSCRISLPGVSWSAKGLRSAAEAGAGTVVDVGRGMGWESDEARKKWRVELGVDLDSSRSDVDMRGSPGRPGGSSQTGEELGRSSG